MDGPISDLQLDGTGDDSQLDGIETIFHRSQPDPPADGTNEQVDELSPPPLGAVDRLFGHSPMNSTGG